MHAPARRPIALIDPLRRALPRVLVAALTAILVLPVASPAPAALAARQPAAPRVVIIVGPSGEATPGYKALAEEGARTARRHGARVTTIVTPEATWPRVRAAMQGASIVVYLGHGNGWPSRYRSEPWPYSQNGLGLNAPGATDDVQHQYFGEYYLERDVKLAKDAVVVLSHLCYASGNSEPGLPPDGLAIAKQRVDNYAAGFIASGASAVIAEGHLGPAYYLEALLTERGSVASIWDDSPTYHDNVVEFASRRSRGFVARVDPDVPGAGFYRSIVTRPDVRTADVMGGARPGGARGTRGEPETDDASSSVPRRDAASFGDVVLRDAPVAGETVRLRLPITDGERRLPDGLSVAVRWDPLLLREPTLAPLEWSGALVPVDEETDRARRAPGERDGAAARRRAETQERAPSGRAPVASRPSEDPLALPAEGSVPTVAWIAPERPGDVVLTEVARVSERAVLADLSVPQLEGLYRLSITLADGDGQPLGLGRADAITPYLVRVVGRVGVSYLTAERIEGAAGGAASLPVRLTNVGGTPWTKRRGGGDATAALVARWIPLTVDAATPSLVSTGIEAPQPGASVETAVELVFPDVPGDYLLVLDVLLPDGSSLAAAGASPRLIRVTVSR